MPETVAWSLQRQAWSLALERGENPFTPEALEQLRQKELWPRT
jgi:hypothetical protein